MEKISAPTSSAPEVIVNDAFGNLYMKGWDRSEVTVTAAPDNITLEESDDVVRLSCRSDCTVRLPHETSLQVGSAKGAVRAKLLHDQINIGDVHGHVDLRDVSDVNIEKVYGHLRARRVAGDLTVPLVKGNVTLRSVSGSCLLENVKGNIDLRDVDGNIETSVKGNARLRLSNLSGSNYIVEADGNIHCRIPQDANVVLDITSEAEVIRVKIPEASQTITQKEYTLTLGNEQASMKLSAKGNVYISASETWEEREADEAYTPLPEDFGDQIAKQVEAQIDEQMEMMNRHLNEHFDRLSESISKSGLSEEEMERIMEQARVKNERASVRAQEKMRRAQIKMERKLEATRRRSEMRAKSASRKGRTKGSWSVKIPTPPTDPVSEEERMMILRMLEQKKISPEEAEELLTALEGQGG